MTRRPAIGDRIQVQCDNSRLWRDAEVVLAGKYDAAGRHNVCAAPIGKGGTMRPAAWYQRDKWRWPDAPEPESTFKSNIDAALAATMRATGPLLDEVPTSDDIAKAREFCCEAIRYLDAAEVDARSE
jgi:hypothetical protein